MNEFPDLENQVDLDAALVKAVRPSRLQKRGKKGNELLYLPNKVEPFTGWTKEAHKNGQVSVLKQFRDGKQDGSMAEWYENGQMAYKTCYKAGKEHGLREEWHEDGYWKDECYY